MDRPADRLYIDALKRQYSEDAEEIEAIFAKVSARGGDLDALMRACVDMLIRRQIERARVQDS
jgi:hypothetical protein